MNLDRYTDKEIVMAMLNRDTFITKEFLYRQCYPLFKSIFDKYYTDCNNSLEFINEIYVYILTPLKGSGKSKLENFEFRCTLTLWLKIVTENYCHQLYAKKNDIDYEPLDKADRSLPNGMSLEIDFKTLNMGDVQKILQMMPNERYRKLIHFRYLEEKSNEETAQLLAMSMDNFYNKHKLAKEQFKNMLRKEKLI